MKTLVVANWKMNPPTWREAKKLYDATKKAAGKTKGISLVFAPPALYIRELAKGARGGRTALAVQNAHFEAGGAHTGELSMRQVKDAGASYVIIGHSEVRARGETNEDTRKKMSAALAAKLNPILCVGELERKNSGEHFNFISEELKAGLEDVPTSALSRVVVAYEPVWAIGGEQTMSPRDMHEMAIFIRKTAVELHGAAGLRMKIIYGGSANEKNAAPMIRDGDVSGLLVGHVSVDIARFSLLLESLTDNA